MSVIETKTASEVKVGDIINVGDPREGQVFEVKMVDVTHPLDGSPSVVTLEGADYMGNPGYAVVPLDTPIRYIA